MYTLSIETKFASAHQLREYNGKCENLHGHSWRVQVVVRAHSLNKIGLAMDFTDLKKLANEIIGPLDHVCLNDLPQFANVNPSSENISRWIFESMKEKVAAYNVELKSVTVWESETAAATYTEE
ncbi:MAG TPA: 6-carboxytetrahydropterin synthase QueD [Dissulfurispiraceae bacterium]|nr:6-carboxytetrahydropterin synthase QueD [Dissulfurispiraceae bacterium]